MSKSKPSPTTNLLHSFPLGQCFTNTGRATSKKMLTYSIIQKFTNYSICRAEQKKQVLITIRYHLVHENN